jgi:prolyl oligopeptidase
MYRYLLFFFVITSLYTQAQWPYPETPKTDTVNNYFGTTVADPYRWLEDDRNEATKNWVTAQNKVTFSYLENIPYRASWLKRIQEINNYPITIAPFRRGVYFYFYKNNGTQNQNVLYRKKGLDGVAEMVIDPNTFSKDGTTAMSNFSLSTNGKYAVVGKSQGGSDWRIFRVMDMNTLQYLPDSLSWIKFSGISWQGNGFYYNRFPQPEKGKELTAKNENWQVYFHKLGTTQLEDVLIYDDKANPNRSFSASITEDERYLFIYISEQAIGKTGNGLWYKELTANDQTFKPIIAEAGKFSYNFVTEHNGKFYIRTNDGAPNFKLVTVDPANPDRANWKTILPEKAEPLTGVNTAGDKMFASYTKDVLSHYYVYNFNGIMEREVKPPALGIVSGFSGRKDDTFVFYSLSSMVIPAVTYKYDIATGKSTLFMKSEIKFNPEEYVMEQRFYTSKDGTKVPAFICYKKGLKRDGRNPTILFGYGGFNITSTPGFSASRITWLEQGGIYCIANLRGGSEYGEKWHEAGMLHKKQNVFDDFIAAANFLVKEKYTSKEYLAIQGSSNGGLLIGAVVNQRPDLCQVAIPSAGVMDMLRYHRFTIGSAWISEYGSSDKETDFKNLYGYSPLHNIKAGVPYPSILVTTADHDDRVIPGHSFKYTATLQEKYKGPNPAMIRVDVNSGHGASSAQKFYESTADIYSFIFYNMKKTASFWFEKGMR